MSRVHGAEEDFLSLSFIDVLSCGLGAAVFLFLVFSAMPHLGSSDVLAGAGTRGAGAVEGPPVDLSGNPEAGTVPVAIELWVDDEEALSFRWPVLEGATALTVTGASLTGYRRVLDAPPPAGPAKVIAYETVDGVRWPTSGIVRVVAAGTVEERRFTLPPLQPGEAGTLLSLDFNASRCWVSWGRTVQGDDCAETR